MGIQEGRIEDFTSVINLIGPTYVPHVKNLLRVWGRILLGCPVDTAIFEKKNLQYIFGGRVIILDVTPLNLQEAVWLT